MKNLLFLLLVILSLSAFGQGMRCPQCPPSPVGHAGEVLGTDGTFLEWVPSGGGSGDTTFAWSTHLNSGTDSAVNSLGTSDAKGFTLKTNNTRRMVASSNGKFTFGNYNPQFGIGNSTTFTNTSFLAQFLDSTNISSWLLVANRLNGTGSRSGIMFQGDMSDSASYGSISMTHSNYTGVTGWDDAFVIQSGGHTKNTFMYQDAGNLTITNGANTAGTFGGYTEPTFFITQYNNTNGVVQTNPHPGIIGLHTSTPSASLDIVSGNMLFNSGAGGTDKRGLEVTGTFTGANTVQNGALFDFTSGGSGVAVRGLQVNMNPNNTNAANYTCVMASNSTAGTGTNLQWDGPGNTPIANLGFQGSVVVTTAGTNVGGYFEAALGTVSIGAIGTSLQAKNSGSNIGVLGRAINTGSSAVYNGGYFYADDVAPTISTSSALTANNGATAVTIFRAQDNGTDVVTVADGGATTFTSSVSTTNLIAGNKSINTTAGDAATINAMAGRFRKDASGTTFTLTNSFVTANSIVLLDQANAAFDGTATSWTKICSANTITIEFNAAPTGNFDMDFLVIN